MKINKRELKTTVVEDIVSIKCDRCGEEYTDPYELQEFHKIDFTGGYGSVFGDETRVEADICQHCLKEMINWFARKTEEYGW